MSLLNKTEEGVICMILMKNGSATATPFTTIFLSVCLDAGINVESPSKQVYCILMKETPRRRISVTSSVNIFQTERKIGLYIVRGKVILRPPHSVLQQASGQIFKDDVNGFSSYSTICFMTVSIKLLLIVMYGL
jgi:hypothetical protein